MNLLPEHLEAYITKFDIGLNKEYATINEEKNMSKLLSLLLKEIQRYQDNEDFHQNNLQTALTSESSNLTTLYVQVKEKNKKNLDVIAELREQIDDMTLGSIAENKELSDKFYEELKQKENSFNTKLESLECELQEERKRHSEAEKKLHEQLALADMKRQQMEAQLKQQIVDKNTQLRQTQNMLRVLQVQQSTTGTRNQIPEKPATPGVLQFNNIPASINKDNRAKNLNNEMRSVTPSINNLYASNSYSNFSNVNNNNYASRSSTPSVVNLPHSNYTQNNINDKTRNPSHNVEHSYYYNFDEVETDNNIRSNLNSSVLSLTSDSTSKSKRQLYDGTKKDNVIEDHDEITMSVNQDNNETEALNYRPHDACNTRVNDEFDPRNTGAELGRIKSYYNTPNYKIDKGQEKDTHFETSKSKYQPLSLNVKSRSAQSAPTTYDVGYNKRSVSFVPGLKPCTSSIGHSSNNSSAQNKSLNPRNKKRKLLDPEDLHYLEDYEPTPRR